MEALVWFLVLTGGIYGLHKFNRHEKNQVIPIRPRARPPRAARRVGATLYWVKVTKGGIVAWKVGITRGRVRRRFRKDVAQIDILKERKYPTYLEAYQIEQAIIRKYRAHRYWGPKLLETGNTELFNKNIFKQRKLA